MIGYIYMITSPSNRIYIGSTGNKIKRLSNYRSLGCKGQKKLFASLKKYGFKNHIFEVIWSGDISEMLQKEGILGNFYNVLDAKKGLNLRLPKAGDIYKAVSEQLLIKMRGRKHSNEVKSKISKSHKGIVFSKEHLRNMKVSAKEKILTKEHRDKINLSKKTNRKWIINRTTGEIYSSVQNIVEKLNLTATNVYTLIKRFKRNKNRKTYYKFEYIDR